MKRLLSFVISLSLIFSLTACGVDEEREKAPILGGAEEILSAMTVEQKIGQLFCVSFSGAELNDTVEDFLEEYSVGNVILFSKNIKDAEQTAKLCRELQSEITDNTGAPAFIGIDQEGGEVVRVRDGAVAYPSAAEVASAGGAEYARKVGEYTGMELKALGINFDFAPVADVNSNPDNPVIGKRAFGNDPETAGGCAAAFIEGMNASMEVSAAKHYPGHGDTDVDSHYGLPMVDKSVDELWQTELLPFKRAIESGVPAIMTAHIIYPKLDRENPASMSKILLTDMLRGELGFDGVIVTDGLRMGAVADNFGTAEACVAAINAGADLLLTGSGGESEDLSLRPQIECIERVREAARRGEISEETLNGAVLRILKCKLDYKVSESEYKSLDTDTLDLHRSFEEEIKNGS